MKFEKPEIVVSRCLGFEHCRYNGQIISSEIVDRLRDWVQFRTVCPEVEIGLEIPRNPVKVVLNNSIKKIMQSVTGRDITGEMQKYNRRFFDSLGVVDGFILKNRSPSCGISDVKYYPSINHNSAVKKGSGFFGGTVKEKFPYLPVEDEGRLRNFSIREHFLTQIFTIAKFRKVKEMGRIQELQSFHAHNKFLLMAYNQERMRTMGNIAAGHGKLPFNEMVKEYQEQLFLSFREISRYTANINVLMHGLGYFSEELSSEEKSFFLEIIEKYRKARIPLSVPQGIMRSWIVRSKEEYLMSQSFFEPYPQELVEISDSGKGRNI